MGNCFHALIPSGLEITLSEDQKVQQSVDGKHWIRFVRKHVPRPMGLWVTGGCTTKRPRPLPIHTEVFNKS